MKKTILIFALLSLATSFASAQVTEGEPSSSVIRSGNRPTAGYFGVYMGITSDAVMGWADKDIKMKALPIVNLKYMITDNLEARLGIEAYNKSQKYKGYVGTGAEGEEKKDENYVSVYQSKGLCLFYPGVAYHFSNKNIFDVYVGGELPIGVVSGDYNKEREYNSKTVSGNRTDEYSSNRFQIGLGAFIGFQCFIANLPLALGLEYGFSFNAQCGDKLRHSVTDSEGNKTTTTTSFTTEQASGVTFSELSASKYLFGNQLRLTLSYYFK